MKKNTRERLAELEHEQWAHWTKHFLNNLTTENKDRWAKQCEVPYNQLTEKEKESDRVWADKVLKICFGHLASLVGEVFDIWI